MIFNINVSSDLIEYTKECILPQYDKNDSGHGTEHIEYVLKRCFSFAKQFPEINSDMLYVIAVYHDIAHHIDKKHHEKLSAEIFYEDERMKHFFTDEQRKIIKEAIEDHRASSDTLPRSDYGKIISSADRSTDIDDFLRRTHSYTLKHFPESDEAQIIERAYEHTMNKYGENGYAKHYLKDPEYDEFLSRVRTLLADKHKFSEYYISAIKKK